MTMKAQSGASFKNLMSGLERTKRRATMLGIGPVSENVIRASFQVAVEEGFPPMFIASRNQVDLKEFGSGYLMGGMDQRGFTGLLGRIAKEEAYSGPLFICRDHGGPWQRNAELDDKLPPREAMELAKRSFKGDVEAGFNYLHIDPTKCPHKHSPDDLVRWTVELVEYCESIRLKEGLPAIDYEIGTEDIQGGDTSDSSFESFVAEAARQFRAKGLPLPVCVVGQTGTLTKLNRNEGGFHASTARRLAGLARKHGIGFKEHNADYLDDMSLALHPDIGISGANVAPEFGYVETSALLELAEIEEEAVANGWTPAGGTSGFARAVAVEVKAHAPWRKWVPSAMKKVDGDALFSDPVAGKTVVQVCGHYAYYDAKVAKAIERLYENMGGIWGSEKASEHVLSRIKESIRRYVRPFNMTGTNAMLSVVSNSPKRVKEA